MNNVKRAKVIMLPANINQTSSIYLWNNELGQALDQTYGTPNIIPHHLYIISSGNKEQDDKIKENDYVYDSYKNSVYQATKVVIHNMKSLDYEQYLKKIIATTDRLIYSSHRETYALPQPSQQFIDKYIESYNKSEVITDVLVEYEKKTNSSLGYNEYCYLTQDNKAINTIGDFIKGEKYQFDDYEIEEKIKINPKDNTITIKKLKDNYNREEVIKLLKLAWKESDSQYDQDDWVFNGEDEINVTTYFEKDMNKWIQENL